jgi:hypothetical protein
MLLAHEHADALAGKARGGTKSAGSAANDEDIDVCLWHA